LVARSASVVIPGLDWSNQSRFDEIMSGMKTLMFAVLLAPVPDLAAGGPLFSVFATCTGRYSAELEHAWLYGHEAPEEIGQRRQSFEHLLDAAMPDDQRASALDLRIQAKVAHAGLLSQAVLSDNADLSAWALRRARKEIAFCAGLLLEM
jgi:hypothetical protein